MYPSYREAIYANYKRCLIIHPTYPSFSPESLSAPPSASFILPSSKFARKSPLRCSERTETPFIMYRTRVYVYVQTQLAVTLACKCRERERERETSISHGDTAILVDCNPSRFTRAIAFCPSGYASRVTRFSTVDSFREEAVSPPCLANGEKFQIAALLYRSKDHRCHRRRDIPVAGNIFLIIHRPRHQ